MSAIKTDLYLGDCLDILTNFDADSIDLIVTSPLMPTAVPKRTAASIRMNMSIGLCRVLKNF